MNRIIFLTFFITGVLYVGYDLVEYYVIQRQFHDTMLVPLLLLANMAFLAFKPAPRAGA